MKRPLRRVHAMVLLFLLLAGSAVWAGHPWSTLANNTSLAQTIKPPEGYIRQEVAPDSFAAWLRGLPLRRDSTVYLYDGRKKRRQDVQVAVLDMWNPLWEGTATFSEGTDG